MRRTLKRRCFRVLLIDMLHMKMGDRRWLVCSVVYLWNRFLKNVVFLCLPKADVPCAVVVLNITVHSGNYSSIFSLCFDLFVFTCDYI